MNKLGEKFYDENKNFKLVKDALQDNKYIKDKL